MPDSPELPRSVGTSVGGPGVWIMHTAQRLRAGSVTTNSALLFANSLLGALLGVVFWTIAARFYDLAAVGLTSALVSASTLIATIANLGFSAVVIRFLPISGDSEVRLSSIATFIPAVLACVGAMVFSVLPVGQSLTSLKYQGFSTATVMFGLAVALAVSAVQDSIFIARWQGVLVLVTDVGGAAIRFLLLVPMAALGAFGLVTTFTAGAVISVILGASAWRKKLKPHLTPLPPPRQMAAYGATNYVSGLLTQAPQLLFPILIATQVSPTAAGAFNFAWLAAALLMTLPPSAANVLLAHLVSNPERAQRDVRRTLFGIIVAVAILAGLTYVAAWVLVPMILPKGAPEVLTFLPILLGGVVLFTVVRLQSMVFAWRGRLIELLTLNGMVAILAIGLPLLLLPKSGVLGLESGWLLSQLVGIVVGRVIHNLPAKRPAHV